LWAQSPTCHWRLEEPILPFRLEFEAQQNVYDHTSIFESYTRLYGATVSYIVRIDVSIQVMRPHSHQLSRMASYVRIVVGILAQALVIRNWRLVRSIAFRDKRGLDLSRFLARTMLLVPDYKTENTIQLLFTDEYYRQSKKDGRPLKAMGNMNRFVTAISRMLKVFSLRCRFAPSFANYYRKYRHLSAPRKRLGKLLFSCRHVRLRMFRLSESLEWSM
jgi:hypothetical protein